MKINIKKGYAEARKAAYPTTEEQLDMLFHDPELWRATIQAIKDAKPKPSK